VRGVVLRGRGGSGRSIHTIERLHEYSRGLLARGAV